MDNNASALLGAPELAGSFVSPKGLTGRLTTMYAGGVVGGVVGRVAADKIGQKREAAPSFGTIGYLAVTAQEVALVRGKAGMLKPKIGDEVIARANRSDIATVELDPGALKANLAITFSDGTGWQFEVPKVHRKTAEHVVRTLTPPS